MSLIRHVSASPHKLTDTKEDDLAVPNIVHYVWLDAKSVSCIIIFLFYQHLQIYSIAFDPYSWRLFTQWGILD